MKSIVKSGLSAAALALTLTAAPAWAELKIGVVDYGKLNNESPQARAAYEVIRSEFVAREKELASQQQSLKVKEDKLSKDGPTMTPDQRSRAEKELRDGVRDFARKQGEFQDDFNARRNEESSRVQRVLNEEVRTYAKAQGFDLVLADATVAYVNGPLDITPAIMAALQARVLKPGTGTPAPAKPPAP